VQNATLGVCHPDRERGRSRSSARPGDRRWSRTAAIANGSGTIRLPHTGTTPLSRLLSRCPDRTHVRASIGPKRAAPSPSRTSQHARLILTAIAPQAARLRTNNALASLHQVEPTRRGPSRRQPLLADRTAPRRPRRGDQSARGPDQPRIASAAAIAMESVAVDVGAPKM